MSDILTATREELIALVYDLIDRVHAQEAQIAYLKDQLHQKGKNNTPMVKPPAFVKVNVHKKKKTLRKKREGSYHIVRVRYQRSKCSTVFLIAPTVTGNY